MNYHEAGGVAAGVVAGDGVGDRGEAQRGEPTTLAALVPLLRSR